MPHKSSQFIAIANPTLLARRITLNDYIKATLVTSTTVEITPCVVVENYTLLPTAKTECFQNLPLTYYFNAGVNVLTGYIDPITNIISNQRGPYRACRTCYLHVGRELFTYENDGTLHRINDSRIEERLPNFMVGEDDMEIFDKPGYFYG